VNGGAVAYLTHSQYGRNGNQITINNSSDLITGNAGNTVSAGEASGTTNAYNTTKGMLASTTGNITGIYDLSGGAGEYIAAWNANGTCDNGDSFASRGGRSTKYATAYFRGLSSNYPTSSESKLGDATYEVNVNPGSSYKAWFYDDSLLPTSDYAFFMRGGGNNFSSSAGLFHSSNSPGIKLLNVSFRVVVPG